MVGLVLVCAYTRKLCVGIGFGSGAYGFRLQA